MSVPEVNLNVPAVDVGLQGLAGEDLSWITTTGVDAPAEGATAPLPTAVDASADKGVADAAKTLEPATVEATTKTGDVKVEEVKVDAVIAADEPKPEEKVEAKAETDEELTEEDSALVSSLPAEQQELVRPRFKRAFFMNHYMNPDRKMSEIVDHLAGKSASRFGEMESAILERNLTNPADFAAKTFKSSPETYTKLVNEFYRGDPKFFARQVTGRDDLTPEEVKARLEFYDAHKDAKFEATTKLSELDEDTLKEIEQYHGPDKAAAVREALEIAQKAKSAEVKEEPKPEVADDPAKAIEAAVARHTAAEQASLEIWNAGRDAIVSYATDLAYDPQNGIGIFVTPEERAAAPLVARLKDFKADVFLDGLSVQGKQLLPGFEEGLNKWGEERPAYMEKILHMDTFARAGEKANVLEVANSGKPLAKTYYDDRLKHPIFKEIDDIIAIVAAQGKAEPKTDSQIPSALPSAKGTAAAGAGAEDWIVQDALNRTAAR